MPFLCLGKCGGVADGRGVSGHAKSTCLTRPRELMFILCVCDRFPRPVTTSMEGRTWPHAVVTRDAESLRFSIYTDDEVRKISVAPIHSSEQRDALQRPLPGGLYDPAMGPTDHYESCITCGLDYATCPGHFGRVELVMPVYNASLFPTLIQILRGACLHCGAFKVDREKLKPYGTALDLIDAGLLVDASKWLGSAPGPSTEQRSAESLQAWVNSSLSAEARRVMKKSDHQRKRLGLGCSSPHLVTLRKRVLHDVYVLINSGKKCFSCSRYSSTLRGDAGCKIFMSPLSSKERKANEALAPEAGSIAAPKGATTSSGGCGGGGGDDEDDEDDEDNDNDTDDDDDDAMNGIEAGGNSANAGADAAENACRAAQPSRSPTSLPSQTYMPVSAGPTAPGGQMVMTAAEAERKLYLLWETEKDVIQQILPNLSPNAFFQRTVPVPPNRFRPPAKVGDQVFEHAQNVWLGKCISLNEQLQMLVRQQEKQASGAALPEGLNVQDRVLRVWDEMCRTVANIANSDREKRGENDKTPDGVKQMLEKKEGLFRMNMMGKRVNFCCRSVISPDVNLGSHEIGVPLHFAKTLTYAQPVTPWNAAELRAAVVNGPNVHPGATMVQEASGELIDLSKRTHAQRMAIAKRLLSADGDEAGAQRTNFKGCRHIVRRREIALSPPPPHWGRRDVHSLADVLTHTRSRLFRGNPTKMDRAPQGGTLGLKAEVVRASCKKVWRHLKNGDCLLVNRQPTLHKPGIMAHVARVLRNEKGDPDALRQLQHVQR